MAADAGFLAAWRDALQEAGWEALASETLGEVAARLEKDGQIWTLAVDRAQRFKFTATRPAAPDAWSDVEIDGRAYAGHHEYRHTLTVTGLLDSASTPAALLADLAFVAEAPALATP